MFPGYGNEEKTMTLGELKKTKEKGEFYIGCKGKVYDVSSNQDMYGEGKGYNVFIGKDSSVALARMKFDAELFNTTKFKWKNLNAKEMKVLDEWVVKFDEKYPVIAKLI